jgi:hypothetical protein
MSTFKLWYCLDDESRELLEPLLPRGWRSPGTAFDEVESSVEIEWLMQQPPRGAQAVLCGKR